MANDSVLFECQKWTVGKLAADYSYIDVHWLDHGKQLDVGPK